MTHRIVDPPPLVRDRMGDLGRIVPPISKSMVIGNGSALIAPPLTRMIRLWSKVFCQGYRSCNDWTGHLILAAIIVEPFESDEQGIGKSPNMGVGCRWLTLIQGLAARKALIFVNRVRGTLSLKPVLKIGASTGDLEDVEGLPAIRLIVACLAFRGLTHEAKEHVHNGTRVATEEGVPPLGRQGRHGTPLRSIGDHIFGLGLFIEGLVEVIQQVNQILVTVILPGLTEALVDSVLHSILNDREESHGSHIGWSVSGPHTLDQILVSHDELGLNRFLVGTDCLQVLTHDEDVEFWNRSQQLDGGIRITCVVHVLEPHNALGLHRLLYWFWY